MSNISSSLEDEPNNDYDEEIKLILLGDSSVGKSNMIVRYSGGSFDPHSISNNNASFINKYLRFGNKVYRVSVWDTAGQERYRSLTKIFIKESHIALLVYAINNKKSYESLDFWYGQVKEVVGDIVLGVAGNKMDLYEEEKVDELEARKKAEEFGAKFKLTSALLEDTGIDEFIQDLVKEYILKKGGSVTTNLIDKKNNNIFLDCDNKDNNNSDENRKKKGGCC